jgi:Zn-dependent M28 family amino/carboxypeptidase
MISRTLMTLAALVSMSAIVNCFAQQPDATTLSPEAANWFAHLQFLAGDDLKGRLIGTPEYTQAAEYVANQFKQAGLKPAGKDGYFQQVPFDNVQIDAGASSLRMTKNKQATTFKISSEAILNPHADADTQADAEAVFAGYGLSIPKRHIDDLASVDLRGKIAVILPGSPAKLHGPLKAYYRSINERWKALRAAGAIGVVIIADPLRATNANQPPQRGGGERPTYVIADPALDQISGAQLVATLTNASAQSLFAGSAHTLDELETLAGPGKPLPKFPLEVHLEAKTVVKHMKRFTAPNVIGLLEGSDRKLKTEYIVISAHLDHLGIGRSVDGDTIYNGAMDNASGVASVLEIAKAIASGPRPKRSVLFVTVTAEEEGLLGSKYFVHSPTVPREKIVADINMDMFLPLFPLHYLEVQGLGESSLGNDVRAVAQLNDIEVQFDKQPDENRFVRSDQASFIAYGIPALAFKFGWLPDSPEQKTFNDFVRVRYHHPSDDLGQPIDKQAAVDFDRIVRDLALRVANAGTVPQFYPESFFAPVTTH